MTQQARTWYSVAAAGIVLVVAAGWYFAAHKAIAPQPSTTTTSTTTGQTGSTTGGAQITGVNTSGFKMPNIDRPYTPPSNLPASIQADSKKAVATAIEQLKIDPNHLAYWLQLAIYRKNANDYTGAEEIWFYCTEVWPTDPVSYNNLADLYENYMHDYAKATTYWNKLISLQPKNVPAYLNLATMQNINLKDSASAKATLQAGLKANPNNTDLQYALSQIQ